jgi:hypothetical protein
MFEEPRRIATQCTTSYEAIILHCAQKGIKGSNKRCKQRLQETTTMTSHYDGHGWEVGGSGVRRISTAARSDKRPVRPPRDHFKRLHEEACPNHVYRVRHKLKDCGMMRSFMTSRSLTWDAELDEGPNGSDTMLFPEENTAMMVYVGRPHQGGAACLA